MKLRAAILLVMLVASTMLAACMVTSGYAVRSTVVLQDGDRQLSQTLYSTCTKIAGPGTNTAQIVPVGWRHWFKRPDGSILILGDQQPCRPPGDPMPYPSMPAFGPMIGPQTAWLFDSAIHPSKVDLFDTSSLADGGRLKMLSVQTAPAVHLPSGGLEAEFPWLESIVSEKTAGGRLMPPPRYPFGPTQQPGNMTGWIVEAYAIEGVASCTDQTAPLVSLDQGSACTRLRPCGQYDDAPCTRRLGNLRLTPDASFQTLVLDSPAPEPAYIATLYTTAGLQSAADILGTGAWPAICYQGLCVNDEVRSFQATLYLPQQHELLRLSRTSMTVGAAQFRSQSFYWFKRTNRGIDLSRLRRSTL